MVFFRFLILFPMKTKELKLLLVFLLFSENSLGELRLNDEEELFIFLIFFPTSKKELKFSGLSLQLPKTTLGRLWQLNESQLLTPWVLTPVLVSSMVKKESFVPFKLHWISQPCLIDWPDIFSCRWKPAMLEGIRSSLLEFNNGEDSRSLFKEISSRIGEQTMFSSFQWFLTISNTSLWF